MTEESSIVEWLKKEGDKIAKGDILFTVETDKSVMEVESFEEGTLLKIVVPPRVSVPVQSTVGFLGKSGEAIPATPTPATIAPAPKKVEVVPTTKSEASKPVAPIAPAISAPITIPVAAPAPVASTLVAPSLFRISPRAAALARDCVIDATRISGSGPDGRVVEKDVKNYLEAKGYNRLRISPAAKQLAAKEKLDVLIGSTFGRIRPHQLPPTCSARLAERPRSDERR